MLRFHYLFESGPSRPALFSVSLVAALVVAGLGAGVVLCAPVAADWLVMTDGSRLETSGAWEVRGRMLVFHDKAGNLSSVRASAVELEASRQLTESMAQRREAEVSTPQAPARESVLRITDDDVSHVDPGAARDEAGAGTTGDDDENSAEMLAVSSWDRDFDDDSGGVLIRGTLRNGEPNAVRSVSIYVILRDDSGAMIGRSRAELDRPFLKPSEQSGFLARFPGISDFATADFRVDATRPAPPPSVDSEADDEASPAARPEVSA